MERTGILLVILRGGLTILIIYARFRPQLIKSFIFLLKIALGLLVLRFSVRSLINYYYYFEAILIPIFILILGWGYQPERFRSALFMLFYTLLLSLPLLVGLVSIGGELGTSSF